MNFINNFHINYVMVGIITFIWINLTAFITRPKGKRNTWITQIKPKAIQLALLYIPIGIIWGIFFKDVFCNSDDCIVWVIIANLVIWPLLSAILYVFGVMGYKYYLDKNI